MLRYSFLLTLCMVILALAAKTGSPGPSMDSSSVAVAPPPADSVAADSLQPDKADTFLRLFSSLDSVAIWLNKKAIGIAPFDTTGLAPGEYAVLARKEGFVSKRLRFSLSPGDSLAVSISLTPAAQVLIRAQADSAVVLQGTSDTLGFAPIRQTGLTAGKKTYTVAAPGHISQQLELTLFAGQTIDTLLSLQPLAPEKKVGVASPKVSLRPLLWSVAGTGLFLYAASLFELSSR